MWLGVLCPVAHDQLGNSLCCAQGIIWVALCTCALSSSLGRSSVDLLGKRRNNKLAPWRPVTLMTSWISSHIQASPTSWSTLKPQNNNLCGSSALTRFCVVLHAYDLTLGITPRPHVVVIAGGVPHRGSAARLHPPSIHLSATRGRIARRGLGGDRRPDQCRACGDVC